jgi:hypothetical protein
MLPQEILKKPKLMCLCNLCYLRKSEETQNVCAYATCVMSGNLKESETCVPVQPMLPQEILKKPKMYVLMQPVLCQKIWKNLKLVCLCNPCYLRKSWRSPKLMCLCNPCYLRKSWRNPYSCAYATCVMSGNLKESETCVPVQPMLPQETWRNPNSCICNLLPQETWRNPNSCAYATCVTSGNLKKPKLMCLCNPCYLRKSWRNPKLWKGWYLRLGQILWNRQNNKGVRLIFLVFCGREINLFLIQFKPTHETYNIDWKLNIDWSRFVIDLCSAQ